MQGDRVGIIMLVYTIYKKQQVCFCNTLFSMENTGPSL